MRFWRHRRRGGSRGHIAGRRRRRKGGRASVGIGAAAGANMFDDPFVRGHLLDDFYFEELFLGAHFG